MSLESGSRLANYEIVEPVGAGGMGEVYRARDLKLGRDVAIKVLPEEFSRDRERVERFEREAKLLAQLNHTNIATLYGFEQVDDRQIIIMELVEGETLAERIVGGRIPVEEIIPIFIEIADGLEAAHDKGIIHRDLKPANIKISADGKPKILDFGLAKAFVGEETTASNPSQSPTLTKATANGAIMGTASYMSPEQARGKSLDKRTDVWAFGCCLYEALTGAKAFYGETVADTISAVVSVEPTWSSVPPHLRRLLGRCLQKKRERRLRDVGDAGLELRETRLESESSDISDAPRQKARLGLWLTTALTAAVAGGALVWLLGTSPTELTLSRLSVNIANDEYVEGHFTNPVAISSDGSRLAFTASQYDQAPRLHLRSRNEFELRRVPNTEGAVGPFFSPDGSWVAFFAEGQLKKVPFDGGAPLVICSVPGRHVGGTWGPDDTIIFADAQQAGLFRVDASGGQPEALTRPDAAKGEPYHGWPQILPDGKTVLFTVESGEELIAAVLSLETGEWHSILQQEDLSAVATYAPSGHLLMAPAGELIAIPFDLDRLEVVGAPRPVVDNVYTSVTNVAWLAVSDTGTLVFAPGTRTRNRLVWVERDGGSRFATEDQGDFWNPRISPDGTKVAVTIQDGSRQSLWTYDFERGTRLRLTTEGRHNVLPVWSPDARWIAFTSSRAGAMNAFLMPSDGSGKPESLLRNGAVGAPSSWSPDGKHVVVISFPGLDISVFSFPGDGSLSPLLEFPFVQKSAMFSPDGRFLAYVSDESGQDEVYVTSFPEAGEKYPISTEGGRAPVWARDGSELFYRSGRDMMAVSVRTDPTFRNERPKRLFAGDFAVEPYGFHDYDVSADGRFLMIETAPGTAPKELRVVQNWFQELKARVPVE